MVRKLCLLKQFLRFAYENGFIAEALSPTIPKLRIPRNLQLPTVFTKEEVNALLAAVDRSNPLGKRDYAILILAAGLGLRVSDIIGLTFDEIDWSKKLLSIVQQKTGKLVELPLSDEIGWAIINYLQNGRPESECNRVFVKHCAPYDALTPSMYRTMQKYLQKAGIKRPVGKPTGMHAFRHSLASAMLEQMIPLPVISGTLGHTDMHSTETYLSIDLHQLRSCALEVDE
ncbi:Tyrosine recombinase XerD [bioreactor metagenome]|uniref:Tyrosine recombinase XerD n=1 Tax=bioreactor metagenome TaxID=1076179 RepID=A0A645FQ65_9ZZZZ